MVLDDGGWFLKCYNLWMNNSKKSLIMEKRGKITNLDRSFDLKFWQSLSSQDRFNATWELILHAWRVKGNDVRQLRL